MGYWRTHYFVPERGFKTEAQTEVFDLPKVGVISNLMLEIRHLSGSENMDIFMSDIVSKVEIIGDGSTVIKSYKGKHIQTIMALDDGKMPPDKEFSPSGACWGYFDIRFGRYPGDEIYGLDCGRWKSLELKITYATAAGGEAGTTGFTATYGKITVWGLYAPVGTPVAPIGYIKSEQKKTYTTVAATEYDLDLPSDYPYRRLLLFQETLGSDVQRGFEYTTINVNSGAKKPVDRLHGNDFRHWQAIVGGHDFWWVKRYYIATLEEWTTIYTPIRFMRQVQASGGAAAQACYFNAQDSHMFSVRGTGSGAGWIQIAVRGICPHGCLALDLEKLSGGKHGTEAMQTAWDCTQADDIDLEFTASHANLSLSIVLEQYVPA